MEKEIFYLKGEFEDGIVYFRIDQQLEAEDEYIYEGTELILEEGSWELDFYELTEEDLQEMYEEGFCKIEGVEFDEALLKSGLNL